MDTTEFITFLDNGVSEQTGDWLIDWSMPFFHVGSWLHCNDEKMRVVSVDEVRRAQAYILVYVRSQAQPVTAATAAAAAVAADSNMKLPSSSVPRFSEMHRRSSEDGRMSLKRRKTTIWWLTFTPPHKCLLCLPVCLRNIYIEHFSIKTLNLGDSWYLLPVAFYNSIYIM